MFGLIQKKLGPLVLGPFITLKWYTLSRFRNMNTILWEDKLTNMGLHQLGTYYHTQKYHIDWNFLLDYSLELMKTITISCWFSILWMTFYRNWLVWNPDDNKFRDHGLYMQRGHDHAAFTRVPEDAKIFRTCKIN